MDQIADRGFVQVSTLERIVIEIAGGLAAIAAVLLWWHLHNLGEQKAGALACITATTETKTEVIVANTADAGAQAVDLNLVVKTYDDQVSALARTNADLARRLHDNPVRQIPAADTGSAPAGALCPVELPDGQASARAAAINAATQKIFDDCDADYAGRLAVIETYNQWRDRMIAAAK
jgi:hypothetical protein